jgi:type II secretory pathway pseudopilin PulG
MRHPLGQRGQSLIEAIVALGILTTAISSALTLASASIGAERESGASITAGNLAREGIEAVRVLRDSNWLSGAAWDQGLYGATGPDYDAIPVLDPATAGWSLDFNTEGVTDATATVWRYTTAAGGAVVGLHQQAAAQPSGTVTSGFSRIVETNPICRDVAGGFTVITSGVCATEKVGVQVVSRVHWQSSGRARTFTAEERLYAWR